MVKSKIGKKNDAGSRSKPKQFSENIKIKSESGVKTEKKEEKNSEKSVGSKQKKRKTGGKIR